MLLLFEIFLLLAFTNYIPILQRHINRKNSYVNYAEQFLYYKDKTIDDISKKRYYSKLANIDNSFQIFNTPNDSEDFIACCHSAIIYLKNHTRNNHLVQEELINYGFCKNLVSYKIIGIVICVLLGIVTILYSLIMFDSLNDIPTENYLALAFNIIMLIFWLIGIRKNMLKNTAIKYAKTLLSAIDTLEIN